MNGNNQPYASVLMLSYNHERFISEAIESVLNQTYTNFELIIIDDASRDQSCQIISRYANIDSRIIKVFHQNNLGIARSSNEGFSMARGEYIAFFSSDDVWEQKKLEKQIEILQDKPNLAVWSDAMIVDKAGNPTGHLFTEKYHAEGKPKSGDLFSSLLGSNYICGQSMILKANLAREIQSDPGVVYLNDYKFMLELARKCDFYFINEPLVQYRIHGDNSISKNRDQWKMDAFRLSSFVLKNYSSKLSKDATAKYYNQIGLYLLDKKHARYARKCFEMAVKNNPKKTSYYKRQINAFISGSFS